MALVTFGDVCLKEHDLTPRVEALKEAYFRAMPEICIERPRLITNYSLEHGLFQKERISILDKARLYRHVLQNRAPIIHQARAREKGMRPFDLDPGALSLFAGSTTTRFKGVPIYPELIGLTIWPELWTISTRAKNPYNITRDEIEELNYEIFPRWMDHNILELARERCYEDNEREHGKKKHAPELKLNERLVFFISTKPNCISHTIPDFSRAVKEGLGALIQEAKDKGGEAGDSSQKEFYQAMEEVLQGMIDCAHNLAAEAERLADAEQDPARKEELTALAQIHRRVPEAPARTFREALTTVWICWMAIHLENVNDAISLGRIDQILWDLYRNDIDSGVMDVGDAVELLCCLWLKIGDHVPMIPDAGEQLFGGTGSNQAITIGGVDAEGGDAVNDLTYVVLRAIELMMLRDPNLNARYYPGVNSGDYLRRLCDANMTTKATPALHNDRAAIKALTSKGETLEQARDYGVIGCVEPGSNGRFYGHSAAILANLTSVLELTLFNGRHRHTGLDMLISLETGDAESFSSFDEFKEAFTRQTAWMADKSTTCNNIFGGVHQDFHPTPILSALFEGPMDKGKDLSQGGATINGSGVTIIGLADVADSLSAIQRVVYEEKEITMGQLLDALKDNFEGREDLQQRLADEKRTPKYGNDDPTADANAAWLVKLLDDTYGAIENYRGGRYRVGYWTMTSHAGFGRIMPATPNGRMAHENFTSGITPVSGVTPDLIRALNSVAGLPATSLPSGVALNLKYTDDDGDPEEMLKRFVAYVEGYFDDDHGQRDGGMEIQFNITDHETFVDAVANPEKYSELLVRVSGYTAYFKDLNPQMQKEIIDRTEYRLSAGKSVEYPPFELR